MCTLVIRARPSAVSTVRVVLFPLSPLGVIVYESILSLCVLAFYLTARQPSLPQRTPGDSPERYKHAAH